MEEYTYFITYAYFEDKSGLGNGFGLGNCSVIRKRKILDMNDVNKLQNEIEEKCGIHNVVIIYYKLFNE